MSSIDEASSRRSVGENPAANGGNDVHPLWTRPPSQAQVVQTWQMIVDQWDKLHKKHSRSKQDFFVRLLVLIKSVPYLSETLPQDLERIKYLIQLLYEEKTTSLDMQIPYAHACNETRYHENDRIRGLQSEIDVLKEKLKVCANPCNETCDENAIIRRLKAEVRMLNEKIEKIKVCVNPCDETHNDDIQQLKASIERHEEGAKLREELAELREALNEEKTKLRDELHAEKTKLQKELSTEVLKQLHKDHKEETMLREELHEKESELRIYVRSTCEAHMLVDIDLQCLSGLSQSESSTLSKSAVGAACHSEPRTGTGTQRNNADCLKSVKLTGFTDGSAFEDLFHLDKESDEIVKRFNENFQKAFADANKTYIPVQYDTEQYDEYITGLQTLGEQFWYSNSNTSAHVPTPNSSEVQAIQPYLRTFLQELIFMLSHERKLVTHDVLQIPAVQPEPSLIVGSSPLAKKPKSTSPPKIMLSDRTIPVSGPGHKRIVDITLVSVARHILEFCVGGLEVAVEVKTFCTRKAGPQKLISTARDQVISHMAKQVAVGYSFAGVGRNAQATGVILTPTCVVILQLRLVCVGTKDVHLELAETACLPLLSRKNYRKWIAEVKGHVKDVEVHNRELYGSTSTEDEVPAGIVALAKLITTSRKNLFACSPCDPSTTVSSGSVSLELDQMIGFGAFASVYSCLGVHQKTVVKISRNGGTNELTKELEVLNELRSECQTMVPNVLPLSDPRILVAGVERPIKALWLEPCAISMQWALANNWTTLSRIRNETIDCLAYVHRKGFAHNDISPKNIMIHPRTHHALLIDFGLAAPLRTEIVGFRGNVLYAHRSLFYQDKVWKCNKENDLASLALSLAVISNDGVCLWRPPRSLFMSDCHVMDAWATDRRIHALRQLSDANLSSWQLTLWCHDSERRS
jgi:Protein kinase domain